MPNAAPSLDTLFTAAVEIADPADRAAYLEQACGPDAAFRARVRALVAAHFSAGESFLASPVIPAPADDTAAFAPGGDAGAIPAGTVIGPYHLREQIGAGGMGVVYVAEQTEPVRRKVALKVIRPGMASNQVVARFEAERQALALMDHPNIARVFDGGLTPDNRPYFVMELVRGEPITDHCDGRKLTVRDRLGLFVQVCRAVHHAHQKGVIHRDIKPGNVLVAVHDVTAVAKVIDFGIAKSVGQELTDKTVYTAFAQMIGTPLYMSPEQAGQSSLDVDTRTDVFSLGVLLYELLTGTTPVDPDTFRKAGLDEVRRVIREDEPPRPSARLSTLDAAARTTAADRRRADPRKLTAEVRGELDWVVMKCLEKDRDRRYESAAALTADVERYLADEPVQAAPPSAGYRLRKFVRRNRRAVLTAVAVAAALVAGTVVSVWQALEANAARRVADREAGRADEEAAIAKAVSEFQRRLLSEASPDKNARNQKVTVEQVLQRAAARIPTELAGQPRVEAAIRLTIGESLMQLGKAEAAVPHLERAAELRRRELGPDHADTLEAEGSVALGYHDRGQFDRAEQLGAAALAACRRVLGNDHPHTVTGMNNLALTYQLLGRNDEAERLFVEGLAGSRRVKGETHRETLATAYNLAQFYLAAKRPAEAELLFHQVLDAGRKDERPETVLTLTATIGLAELHSQRDESKKAEGLFRDAVAIARRVVGDDHPYTAGALHNLGTALLEREEPEEAEPFLMEALAISRRVHEPGHPDIVPVMESTALVLLLVGKPSQTAALLMELIEFHDHKRVGPPPGGLGLEFVREMLDEALLMMEFQAQFGDGMAKRYDAAAALMEEVVSIRRKVNGPDHPKTFDATDELASIYVEAKRPEKAIPLLEEVLKRETTTLGRKHTRTVGTITLLGNSYRDVGRLADALSLLREAHDALPVNNRQRRLMSGPLLGDYVKAGRIADAVAFGKQLGADVKGEVGIEALGVANALATTGLALLNQEAFAAAEALARESLAIRARVQPDGWQQFSSMGLIGAALAGQGKNAEAERLLIAAHEGLGKTNPPPSADGQPRLREAVGRLVRFYESTNRPDKAREWAAKMPREVAPRPRPAR